MEISSFEKFILDTCGFGRSKRQMLKELLICVCNAVIPDLWKFSLFGHLVKVHQPFFWLTVSALQGWFLKHFFGFKDKFKN